MSLNQWIGIGRLTSSPELRYTNGGKPVASFTLAVDRDKKEDGTDFVSIVAWNKTAELVSQYLDKGRLVAVDGRLSQRSYENKEGQKVRVWEIVANKVQFLDRGEQTGGYQPSTSEPPTNRRFDDDPFAD